MALYWYARSAKTMPLLQYLACYQVIEFYFPIYASSQSNSESKASKEKEQLEITLLKSLELPDLITFITASKGRGNHFSKANILTTQALKPERTDIDLIKSVAQRIYNIRCKIVHTKSHRSKGNERPIFPHSKEVDIIQKDIELIHFISRRVLLTASNGLSDY